MVWVKICGITSEEDALLAVAMGADAVGFIFAAGSKRQVSAKRVEDIVRRLDPGILTIGVFRDELPERVVDTVHRAGLGGAQLHGHETAATAAYVAARVGFTAQVFAAGDRTIDRARDYPVDAVMIDNPTPGSGELFDWSLTDGAPNGKRLIVAGGLTPDNVADAIVRTRPWGVDVATGVERSPGVKDPRKVRAFVHAAREGARRAEALEPRAVTTMRYGGPDGESGSVPYDWAED